MNRKRFFLLLLFALLTLLPALFLWSKPWVAAVALFFVSLGMFLVRPSLINFKIFLVGFFLGPLAEITAVVFGAWQYVVPEAYLGIPIWLPFVWGNVGLFIANMPEVMQKVSLFKKDERN